MSSFISTAGESLGGSNKAEELEGRQKEDDSENGLLKQREFFWDNIVLFVVSTLLGLAAIDVITEFIRGGGVACFPPLGANVDEAQAAYINNFCAGFVPVGAYIPAFMVVHAILITVPHYLWLNHYGGNFDFFFQQASCLKRSRDGKTGQHITENLIIAQQLESTFATYRRNSIYHLYIVKLIVQFLWTLLGIGFAIGFFLSEFDARFLCPPNLNTTSIESWPLDEPVWCVFETLSLLQALWIADILLLLLALFGLFWAIVWSFTTHPTELGSKQVASFAFESGLAPQYYVPNLPVFNCLHKCFTFVPYISCSGPDVIKTDLDFLIMCLFLTDNGLGHVLKEVQIELELKNLLDDDQRRLRFHERKQNFIKADDVSYDREKDYRDIALDGQDLKWSFPKRMNKIGIYRDFESLPQDQRLVVTSAMRGAVLGIGARAPSNSNSINISFGDTGYATALARVFKRVAHLDFNAAYNNLEEVVTVRHFYTNVVSLVFAESILSSPSKIVNQALSYTEKGLVHTVCACSIFLPSKHWEFGFYHKRPPSSLKAIVPPDFVDKKPLEIVEEKLRILWVPPNTQQFLDTAYIVIGPIPREKYFHLTNLDDLLEKIAGCLLKDAVLVSIWPLKIAGKKVDKHFIRYEPSKFRFTELPQDSPEVATGHPRLPQWQARKSFQETLRSQGRGGVSGGSSESQQGSTAVTQPLLSTASKSSDAKNKSPPSSPTQVGVSVVPGGQRSLPQQGAQIIKPHRHSILVTCSGVECEMEFSFYAYKDDPHVRRPKMFDPPPPATRPEQKPGETKVKNVNETAGKSANVEGAATKQSTI